MEDSTLRRKYYNSLSLHSPRLVSVCDIVKLWGLVFLSLSNSHSSVNRLFKNKAHLRVASDCLSRKCTRSAIPGHGPKAHFAEVSFSVAGCLQMAEAGVWNMLSYFIHNTHVL